MTRPFADLQKEWLTDPAYAAEYERLGPIYEVAFTLAEARRKSGLTQAEIARRMGTSQAAIARLEAGGKPKWETVERYAAALGMRAAITLYPLEAVA